MATQSVMVSVVVSNLGKTAPVFVTPKAKLNSVYYCDEVLGRGLLPFIHSFITEIYIALPTLARLKRRVLRLE